MSLAGLAYVQYRLLITGLQLQKTTLDRQVGEVLKEVKAQLHLVNPISEDIAFLSTPGAILIPSEKDTLAAKIKHEFATRLQQEFSKKGLESVQFAFAMTTPGKKDIFFGSDDFAQQHSRFSRYTQPLSGAVVEGCHCQMLLRLNVQNLFSYLLRQLQSLLLPSLFFLLLLAGCLIWLIRLLNRQRNLAEVKNDFINNLTHELKTPVFSISLASKMLTNHLAGLPSEKPLEYLNLIRSENEKMKEHIDKVLELASLESGKYVMDKNEVQINAFLINICERFEAKIKLKSGLLTTSFFPNDRTILLDKSHFSNAIENILDNALKYSQKASPKIDIRTLNSDNHIIIKISDQGKGIPKEKQKHIFDKFYRVGNGNVHDVKGFGLGLSYVRQVIERHHGSIHVSSELNIGSTFTIKIPVK